MKTWQVVLLSLGGVALVCCGGGAFIGMRVFNNAKNVDAEADHFADAFFSKVSKNWEFTEVQNDLAPEWVAQPQEVRDAYNKLFRDRLGSLKSAEPFSAINTFYSDTGGGSSTVVTVRAQATFEKADGTVTMSLRRKGGVWKAVTMKINSDALVDMPTKKNKEKKSLSPAAESG